MLLLKRFDWALSLSEKGIYSGIIYKYGDCRNNEAQYDWFRPQPYASRIVPDVVVCA